MTIIPLSKYMSNRSQPQSFLETLRDRAIRPIRFIGRILAKPSFMAVLTLTATIGSTVAAFFTWEATLTANKVSSASQALAQKVYNDQIAMGHPSVSVLSGETEVSGGVSSSYSAPEVKIYAATVVLRNSGQRDSPRAWVALSSDSFLGDLSNAVLVTLPKEIDVPVRFDLRSTPSTQKGEDSWFLAIVYEDEVPSSMIDPASAQTPLRVVCSKPAVFRMTSWPKDIAQDPSARVLSLGSPVAVEQAPLDSSGWSTSARRIEAARDQVIQAAHAVRACLDMPNAK